MQANGRIRHSVGTVEQCRFNRSSRVGDPRIQFAARYAGQTAGRIEPERLVLVLRDPMNCVAGQAVLAG